METTYDLVDKSMWPEGIWKDEPDEVIWVDEETGLKCKILRQPLLGHLCGYVHALLSCQPKSGDYEDLILDVHGGITYGKVKDGQYVIGFDCIHGGDLAPGEMTFISTSTGEYRNIGYVKSECESLAKQIREKYIK